MGCDHEVQIDGEYLCLKCNTLITISDVPFQNIATCYFCDASFNRCGDCGKLGSLNVTVSNNECKDCSKCLREFVIDKDDEVQIDGEYSCLKCNTLIAISDVPFREIATCYSCGATFFIDNCYFFFCSIYFYGVQYVPVV